MLKYFMRTCLTLALILISTGTPAGAAGIPGLGSPDQQSASAANISTMSEEELTNYLATISDEDSRKLLLAEMQAQRTQQKQAQAETMVGSSYISFVVTTLQERSRDFRREWKKVSNAPSEYREHLQRASQYLLSHGSTPTGLLFRLLLILLGGAAAIYLLFKSTREFRASLRQDGHYATYARLGRSALGIALDLFKIAVFTVITLFVSMLLFDKDDPAQIFISAALFFIASAWAIRDVFREVLFSPVSRGLFIKGKQCQRIYFWSMMGFFVPVLFGIYASALAGMLDSSPDVARFNLVVLLSISVVSLIAGTLLLAREKSLHADREGDVLRSMLANNRYWLVILALVGFYMIGIKNVVIGANLVAGQRMSPGYLYYALLMFIFTPMYLRIVKHLVIVQPVKLAQLETDTVIEDRDENEESAGDQPNFSKWARRLFTLPYVVLIILFTLEGANIGLLSWFTQGGGADFGRAATGVFVACMLGVVAWNIVNSYINRRLPATVLDPTVLMGSEGGGDEAATRTQTILPIVRSIVLVMIMIIVLFSVLSSLGISTAPLLAGAGVIGIAVGFGAQKLVEDVVSGVFFLFEDAFRIGEYIDTGSLVGTVESTSVRSLRLRHHLGAVQTIPYGEIRSVKNLSRDFVIMKLKFRVPFDTDIEIVRKTIKKVGQELLKDPELGEDFIAPLKSQGVQTAEDDALVIRMKFTAKPGKQWMIKREAYRLVQEALAAKGIHFAPRQVTVHIPESEKEDPQAIKQAAGAAALSAEAEKSSKPADPLADL